MRALRRLDAHLRSSRPSRRRLDRLATVLGNPFGMGRHTEGAGRRLTAGRAAVAGLSGASMDDVDLDARWPVSSATRPPSTPGRWLVERALVNQGFLDPRSDGR